MYLNQHIRHVEKEGGKKNKKRKKEKRGVWEVRNFINVLCRKKKMKQGIDAFAHREIESRGVTGKGKRKKAQKKRGERRGRQEGAQGELRPAVNAPTLRPKSTRKKEKGGEKHGDDVARHLHCGRREGRRES